MRNLTRSRRLARWIGAGLLAGLIGCVGYFPLPEEHHLPYATRLGYPATLASLNDGRHIFVMKCDGCHGLPSIRKFSGPLSETKWNQWLDSMRTEAELSPREDSLVRAYVLSASGWLQDSLAVEREKKAVEKKAKEAPAARP